MDVEREMEEVARIVLALESPDVAEEVMHFLDRTGRARVVGTAVDASQLAEAVRQLEPDAVVAAPSLVPARGTLNGSALLAVDTSQSVGALRRAIRAGATGFYLWPAEREELGIAAARVGPKPDETVGGRAPVIAVYAPRGGAGATFIATHLAAAFAKRDRRCILIDLDVLFADVSAAIGVPIDEPPRTIADLSPLGDELATHHLEEVIWRHPGGFAALLAPWEEQRFPRTGSETYRAAITAAQRSCEVVVLHTPRALDEIGRTGLEVADRVLMVLGLDVLSFRDAKRAIQVASLDGRCSFVVNRAGRSEITPGDVERVFGQPAVAVIPSDRAVGRAQDHGRLVPMRGRIGRALDRLATQVLEAS
jgi:pilus assembly protein CpaE